MGRKKGNPNWGSPTATLKVTREINEPTAWDLFLREIGLSEDQALMHAAFKGSSHHGNIRSWVCRHRPTRYIPEIMIEALGLATDEAGMRSEHGVATRKAR